MNDPRLDTLRELADAIRALIARLQDPAARPEALEQARRRVDAVMAAYREHVGRLGEPAPEHLDEFRELISEAMRLNAIATSVAQCQATRSGHALEGVRNALRGVARVRTPRVGRSCDVRG